eukprot:gene6068-8355_t
MEIHPNGDNGCPKLPPAINNDNQVGIMNATVGYAGGLTEWPTYRRIQDHTEAIRLVYDENVLPLEDILTMFFLEQGGPPRYPSYNRQYRSAILVHTPEQRARVDNYMKLYRKTKNIDKIYTDIEDGTDFYRAEEYHQKYMEKQSRKWS